MANEKFKSISDQQLIRRKRFVLFMVGLSFGLALFCLVLIIFKLLSDERDNLAQLLPGLLLPLIVLPMYMGVKKINLELTRREAKNKEVN